MISTRPWRWIPTQEYVVPRSIPITGPYSDLLSSSALTETGHKRRIATSARKMRENEVATLRAVRDLDGRRGRRAMVGGGGGGKERMSSGFSSVVAAIYGTPSKSDTLASTLSPRQCAPWFPRPSNLSAGLIYSRIFANFFSLILPRSISPMMSFAV